MKRICFLHFALPGLFFFTATLAAQQRLYFNQNRELVDSTDEYAYYADVQHLPNGFLYIKNYIPPATLVMEGAYSRQPDNPQILVKEGLHKYYQDQNQLWHQHNFQAGVLEGELRSWYPSGKLKRIELFKNGQSQGGQCFAENGASIPFTTFSQTLHFPGGEPAMTEFFEKQIRYPKRAYELAIEGRVELSVEIDAEGNVQDINVAKGLGFGCDEEAVRVAGKMPKWNPEMLDDVGLTERANISVFFDLKKHTKRGMPAPGGQVFDLISDVLGTKNRFYLDEHNERIVANNRNYTQSGLAEQLPDGLVRLQLYEVSGRLTQEGNFSRYCRELKTEEGLHRFFKYSNDTNYLYYTAEYNNGLMDGLLQSYYPSGKIKRIEQHRRDTLLEGQAFAEDGSPIPFTPHYQPPTFPGGEISLMQYLAGHISYPPIARESNIQGVVLLSFVVGKDGTIKKAKIVQEIGGGCGQEALRVLLLSPKWLPARLDDELLQVRFTLPVRFKLE